LATSDLFDALQRMTLAALCDTFIPALEPPAGEGDPHGFWARSASHAAVPEGVEVALLGAELPPEQAEGIRALLDSLAENGIAPGTPQPDRERIVHAISDQSPEALAGIHSLRGIAKALFYALPDLGTGRNPTWEAIGYPGPLSAPPDRERLLRIRRPAAGADTLAADVCIVGSGAGGGVIAGELAAAGKSVVVLEMGGHYDDRDFDQLELSAYERLYLNGGPFPTADGQVSVVAGSCVGGGTVVNWTNCLRTHDWVREEWAREHGLEDLDGPEFDAHLDAVSARMRVNGECSDLNGPHQRLAEGCERFGYDFRGIVRNADRERYDPASAAYMGFGDQSGSKLSTAKTYLLDAQAAGAEIVAGCRAERILVEGGRAAGVEAVYVDPEAPAADGASARLTVRAPVVVVACGAIESPALLMRSQIGGPATGAFLRLHPTAAVTAYYSEPQNWCWGPPQAALSHEFADLGDGHGFLIESAQSTTGLFAGAVPWRSGRDHKQRMKDWAYAAPLINLTREQGHGKVTIDEAGGAVTHYPVTDEVDIRNIRAGVETLIRIHEAAGAEEIVGSARKSSDWRRGDDLDAFIADVTSQPIAPREFVLFSAHQMGSCRMGADPASSVADPRGELHDTPGVWIGDASAFPTPSGTNPMLTIMALARRTAHAIAAA
jgi:choline dehydrogenase-like flavoprotein